MHYFLCLDKALQKGRHAHPPPSPPNPHLAADCTGERTAPRGALMPPVIICDTRLSLRSGAKQQPEHSGEQQGRELISQPSGAGKRCRHHPVVLKPDWSKEPPYTCKWYFNSEVKNAEPPAWSILLKKAYRVLRTALLAYVDGIFCEAGGIFGVPPGASFFFHHSAQGITTPTLPPAPFFEISKDNFQAQRILMHFRYFKSQYYCFIS